MDGLEALRATVNDAAALPRERLEALGKLADRLPPAASPSGEVNNHVHTIYSFSPYSPSMAALLGREAGLEVVGSVDHDSIAASTETLRACATLGIGGVTGCELRVSFKRDGEGNLAPFADRKINNPDSEGIVYMTIQGVPASSVGELSSFLEPIRRRRMERTCDMTESASELLRAAGLGGLDFATEVVAASKAAEGGGLTERHVLAAVARRAIDRLGRGRDLVTGLETSFGLRLGERAKRLLADGGNPHIMYDLLGSLKTGFLDRIFIQPDGRECVPAAEAIAFARSIGAIPAYAYLGDVGESPTGDKKAEKFEDDFLEALFDELERMGYLAVTYMPPRNSPAQLARVRALCVEHGFMEISGVDINQPRQSFNCPELRRPEFRHLVDTTWALVAHERFSSIDRKMGLFSPDNPLSSSGLEDRLAAYARAGRSIDARRPETAADLVSDLAEGRFSP